MQPACSQGHDLVKCLQMAEAQEREQQINWEKPSYHCPFKTCQQSHQKHQQLERITLSTIIARTVKTSAADRPWAICSRNVTCSDRSVAARVRFSESSGLVVERLATKARGAVPLQTFEAHSVSLR